MSEDNYSEVKLKLRRSVLRILFNKFSNNKAIYECADEWCEKQVTSNGVVDYYNAYFGSREK